MIKDERRPYLFIFDTHKASGESFWDYFSSQLLLLPLQFGLMP